MQAFIAYYYQLFEQNRPGLGNLYQDASERIGGSIANERIITLGAAAGMLTFEGQKFQGAQAIVAKLNGLQFGLCKITLATQDFQPSISGGILVFTTGNIQVQILHHR